MNNHKIPASPQKKQWAWIALTVASIALATIMAVV